MLSIVVSQWMMWRETGVSRVLYLNLKIMLLAKVAPQVICQVSSGNDVPAEMTGDNNLDHFGLSTARLRGPYGEETEAIRKKKFLEWLIWMRCRIMDKYCTELLMNTS